MSKTYYADMTGEDGLEFSRETTANSLAEAREYFDEMWPDARINDVYSEDTARERANARYRRLERAYDDDFDYMDGEY